MERNIGDLDSKIRLGLGGLMVLIGVLGYFGVIPVAFGVLPQALTSAVLLVAGAVLFVTGYFRKCGLYRLIGADTA